MSMIRDFVRRRRETTVQKINKRLEVLNQFLAGCDPTIWNAEYGAAEQERQRLAIKRRRILTKLPRS